MDAPSPQRLRRRRGFLRDFAPNTVRPCAALVASNRRRSCAKVPSPAGRPSRPGRPPPRPVPVRATKALSLGCRWHRPSVWLAVVTAMWISSSFLRRMFVFAFRFRRRGCRYLYDSSGKDR